MPVHADFTIELPLTGAAGLYAVLQAVPAEHGGWDVSVRREGCLVVHKHCGDWHRVERLRSHIESNRSTQVPNGCEPADSSAA